MKTSLLATLALLCVSAGPISAQIIYSNNFNSSMGPILGFYDNDGLLSSGGTTETWNWSWSARSFGNAAMYGGGALRSITDTWPPTTTPNSDWVFLPQLTMPSNARLVFEFQAETEYNTWNGHPGLDVRVSTTDTLFPSYITVKTISYSESQVELEYVDLSAYAGQAIYIAFVNTAPSSPYYGWRRISIDDIVIGAFSDYDFRGFNFLPVDYGKTSVAKTIRGAFVNTGNETITSADFNYRVNSGTTVTEALTGLSVDPFDTLKLDHATAWIPSSAGVYDIEIWIDNLNGNVDGDNTNDTLYRTITVYDKVVKKRPMIELFSGSNCSACSPLAADIDPFISAWGWNEFNGDFSCVEYQTFTLDPSSNPDGITRESYYSVSGYPDEQISDVWDYKTLLFDEAGKTWYPFLDFTESQASTYPAFVEMEMDVTVSGNNVEVTVSGTPLQDFTGDYRLHIAVCEKEYTYTGGSTGQTVFKHVMRKMLPDGNGTSVSLTEDVPFSITEDYTFTVGGVVDGSYNLWVGMDNIEVVAFIQNNSTEDVIQSVTMGPADIAGEMESEHNNSEIIVFPVPATDHLFVQSVNGEEINGVVVTSVSGTTLITQWNGNASDKMTVNTDCLPSGIYFIHLQDSSGATRAVRKFIVR